MEIVGPQYTFHMNTGFSRLCDDAAFDASGAATLPHRRPHGVAPAEKSATFFQVHFGFSNGDRLVLQKMGKLTWRAP